MALGVAGVAVGIWTAPEAVSGCTVVLPPDGTVGALAVRGAGPGTREAVALGPFGKVTECHGVVLSGGSAFGLATADGAMRWLEARGVGYRTATARVPIVGAAILLDASVGRPEVRPAREAGWAACEAAVTDDPAEGRVGAGAGCTIAKVAGLEHAWRGGQGVAVVRAAGVSVGAVVANNGVGELVAEDGSWLARARVPDDAPRFPAHGGTLLGGPDEGGPQVAAPGGPPTSTVIGCVVTDARIDKRGAHRVADLAHSGMVRALSPAHTDSDGDALFCLATGQVPATLDLVAHLAAEAVAVAARRGPLAATGDETLPGLADA